ncbi:MAG: efflux RND transporter periplasmic adaptor subunit [Gammaproteobacteria bacterium]|nr:efflux RND transporter periplasmic adaptor subunit [Gammaproteobacteria bacterium]
MRKLSLIASLGVHLTATMLFTAAAADNNQTWQRVEATQQPQWLELSSMVEAVSQATVSAQTSGRIIELPYDVNDLVPQGAVIVRFTDTEQKARLQKAQGAMTEAQSRFDEQQKELVRVKDIHSKGLVAKAALDLAQANFNAAKARQDQAVAAVAEAQEQLEQTVVRAPYTGIMQERYVELGELAVPGKPLLKGLSLEHLRLVAQVPQHQLTAARNSMSAQIALADGKQIELGQPKLVISPQADSASHSFQLRVNLPKADHSAEGLLPGSWQKLQLQTGVAEQVRIAKTSVLWRGEQSMVFRQQGDKSVLQPIRVQAVDANTYRVISGLNAGDMIASDANAMLAQQAQKPVTQQ